MPDRMWSLGQFRFDEGIDAAEVWFPATPGNEDAEAREDRVMARDEAIALSHAQGANLVAEWPATVESSPAPSCFISKVSLPLRWERLPDEDPSSPDEERSGDPPFAVDERLWFEARCGGRDFILGNPHTFVGRMQAWCPADGVGYRVSLGEMGAMSDEARYFVAGFLAGSEPRYPIDDADEWNEADMVAWESATRRFRRTGSWFGRWRTCRVCGCVLLPDTAADRCHEHSGTAEGPGPG